MLWLSKQLSSFVLCENMAESWEVLKECYGNYTYEYMNELIV